MLMGKAVGIDLGTTNSVVAAIEATQPTIILNAEGLRTTASIVAHTKEKRILVGQIAKRQNIMNPENTFFFVKRFIGSKMHELDPELLEVPYKVISDKDDNILFECPILNKKLRPEEISAQILKKLAEDATAFLKQEVDKAVITVPAYFNASQRRATQDAGKIAGLEVLRIINEPTAASLAYGLEKNTDEIILVFDLGGGTFDVSILEVGDGIFEVLATAGDTCLGGSDFDLVIFDYIIDQFNNQHNINIEDNVLALQRISEAAEKAKIALTTSLNTTVSLPFITATSTGPKHLDVLITREKFEELSIDLIERCQAPLETALVDAGITMSDINQVVLVGGSTRVGSVQKLLNKLLNNITLNQSVNPDEVVAIGAAIQASILAGEVREVLLLDVTPLTLGIETLGGIVSRMIPRNTTIPTRATEIFSTALDYQPSVDIQVVQGEREFARDNKTLGIFRLDLPEPVLRGVPQIEVTFDIDVNGILLVTALDKGTGAEQSIKIADTSNLKKSEVDRLVATAEEFADYDSLKRARTEMQTDVDAICLSIEQIISDLPNYIISDARTGIEVILIRIRDKMIRFIYRTIVDTPSKNKHPKEGVSLRPMMSYIKNLFKLMFLHQHYVFRWF